ncbi:hypothetical protein IJV79_04705 [bacterium]|nr:hypothetical protein [bacterium]
MNQTIVLTEKQQDMLYGVAQRLSNNAIVLDFFCDNQPEIMELMNIIPIVKCIKDDADILFSQVIKIVYDPTALESD